MNRCGLLAVQRSDRPDLVSQAKRKSMLDYFRSSANRLCRVVEAKGPNRASMKLACPRKRVLNLAQIDCDYPKLVRILQNEPITCYQRKLVELSSGHMKGVEIVKSP
jgi:hypothetical protein